MPCLVCVVPSDTKEETGAIRCGATVGTDRPLLLCEWTLMGQISPTIVHSPPGPLRKAVLFAE